MADFSFEILRKEGWARAGVIRTRHGDIETPAFVPVATRGAVRSISSKDLEEVGAQCALANTYHFYLMGGDVVVKKFGGLHKFMNFQKPLFTDSGGFQVFSFGLGREHGVSKIGGIFPKENSAEELGRARKKKLAVVTDEGVSFRSIYDGSLHFINPKISMKIQSNLGADIIMAFDECTSPLSDYSYTKESLDRTHRWALESLKFHDPSQALYGIIQGSEFEDLRRESSRFILKQGFDGIAVGGSLGKTREEMYKILGWINEEINEDNRPRHLLGIGSVEDVFRSVALGIDTFDCVSPTRLARHGSLFISPENGGECGNRFMFDIQSLEFKEDFSAIDPDCDCYTCKNFSRAYLHHLFRANKLKLFDSEAEREPTYLHLATIHNMRFMMRLMEKIREAIKEEKFGELKRVWLKESQ